MGILTDIRAGDSERLNQYNRTSLPDRPLQVTFRTLLERISHLLGLHPALRENNMPPISEKLHQSLRRKRLLPPRRPPMVPRRRRPRNRQAHLRQNRPRIHQPLQASDR